MFGRTRYEGRKASDIYSTKTSKQIVADQCKDSKKGTKK